MDGVTLVPRGVLKLAEEAVVGTVDVAAVGARVLLSLQPPSGWSVQEVAADICGLSFPDGKSDTSDPSSLRPVLARAAEAVETLKEEAMGSTAAAGTVAAGGQARQPPVLLVRNMYPPGAAPDAADAVPGVSLVVLNAAVPEEAQAEVAAALLDLLESSTRAGGGAGPQAEAPPEAPQEKAEAEAQGSGRARAVVLVASMLLQHQPRPAALYQLQLNGAAPLDPSLPPLPTSSAPSPAAAAVGGSQQQRAGSSDEPSSSSSSAPYAAASAAQRTQRVRDGQLAALLHVAAVSGTPAVCLLAPGHKPPASTPLDLPDSLAACDAAGSALAAALGLRYDADACRTVRAQYKWFVPEKAAGCDVMYL